MIGGVLYFDLNEITCLGGWYLNCIFPNFSSTVLVLLAWISCFRDLLGVLDPGIKMTLLNISFALWPQNAAFSNAEVYPLGKTASLMVYY